MGYYINRDSKGNLLPQIGKAKALIADGAKVVDGKTFEENMVCVVENPFSFDAALYAYKSEYEYVKKRPDSRSKVWLVHPMAKELSGYAEDQQNHS